MMRIQPFVLGLKISAFAFSAIRGILVPGVVGQVGVDLKAQCISKLWPVWISEYSKLKLWSDPQAYAKRMALGVKYVFPVAGALKPYQLSTFNVVDILESALRVTKQTHTKVLIALSQFLRWCVSKNLIQSTQRLPTDLTLLEPVLGMRLRVKGGHHPAVDWRDVPRFVSKLRRERSEGARALLFAVLTTCRAQSVCMAEPGEFNIALSEWNIPALHMKGKQGNNQPHDVPLSRQALSLIKQRLKDQGRLLFTATGNPLSSAALRKVIRKLDAASVAAGTSGFRDPSQNGRVAVTHGFRAAFATWAQETGQDMSVVERCLAHVDPLDRHQGAYRRGTMLARRRELLQAWADYCFSYSGTD